jgi:hypothetical protein
MLSKEQVQSFYNRFGAKQDYDPVKITAELEKKLIQDTFGDRGDSTWI